MKKAQAFSFLLLVLTLAVMAVNMFAIPLPDWAIRTAGVVILLALPCMTYSVVRGEMEQ